MSVAVCCACINMSCAMMSRFPSIMVSVISAWLVSCAIAALQTYQAFFSPLSCVTEIVSIHTLLCSYDINHKLSNW